MIFSKIIIILGNNIVGFATAGSNQMKDDLEAIFKY
jgi:hypothetical protein